MNLGMRPTRRAAVCRAPSRPEADEMAQKGPGIIGDVVEPWVTMMEQSSSYTVYAHSQGDHKRQRDAASHGRLYGMHRPRRIAPKGWMT